MHSTAKSKARKSPKKEQSAMEYLMTYGWAILIIAVVLGVLYYIGIFNGAYLAPKVPSGACKVFRPNGPETTQNINTEGDCLNGLPQYVGSFTSYNSYISIPPSSLFSPSTLTVSFWMYPKVIGGGGSSSTMIVGNDNLGLSQWNWGFEFWPAGIDFHSCTSSCTGTSDIVIPQDAWSYVTGTYNGIWSIYINGAFKGSGSGAIEGSFDTGILLGTAQCSAASACYQGYFNGYLADVQIYNTTLDANTIQYLYDEGIGGVPQELQNLVGWWPLNGDVNDYSGNLNDGMPSNVVFTSSWVNGYTSP